MFWNTTVAESTYVPAGTIILFSVISRPIPAEVFLVTEPKEVVTLTYSYATVGHVTILPPPHIFKYAIGKKIHLAWGSNPWPHG